MKNPENIILKNEEKNIIDSNSMRRSNIELKNKLLELSKINIELENENLELTENNLELQNKILYLEDQIKKLKKTNNNLLVNNIFLFGHESLEHITIRLLERYITEIIEFDYDNLKNKFLEINGQKYRKEHIKDIDIHLLLTRLIYTTNIKNRTIKKENNKYFINSDNGWENVDFNYLNEKILTKHQEVLSICEPIILENKLFMRAVKHYFQDDENYELIIKPTGIENTFLENYPRNIILKKLLDYELDNLNKLDKINHSNNIVY